MCGFEALTYVVWRRPPDCASIRTTIATAAIARTTAAACPARFIKRVSLLFRRRYRRRPGEARRLDIRIRANRGQLERVAAVEPGLYELERHLHAVHVTVIGVVGL